MSTIFLPEVGLSHDGSLPLAFAYIRQLAADGATIVKFQCHLAAHEPWQRWRKGSPPEVTQGQSRREYLERTAFTYYQWTLIRAECHRLGVQFACSVFCPEAVDYLVDLPDLWKVPHTKALDGALRDQFRQRRKRALISVRPSEVEQAQALWGDQALAFLLCDGHAPTTARQTQLAVQFARGHSRFASLRHGLSYHLPSHEPVSWAAASDLPYVEAHVIFSRHTPVPDAPWSLEPDQWRQAIKATQLLRDAA